MTLTRRLFFWAVFLSSAVLAGYAGAQFLSG
jgi:hypothetical protein